MHGIPSAACRGQADIGLSARGEAQATALRATIEAMRPDHVIASDLLRARHTAALLGYPHAQLSPGLARNRRRRLDRPCHRRPDG
ncbi:histidine phosphatase family protein (plasmid) [Sinorhizobium meliloti]|nr:histidine phosphatase family protein [Sinorhizobium meliloti]